MNWSLGSINPIHVQSNWSCYKTGFDCVKRSGLTGRLKFQTRSRAEASEWSMAGWKRVEARWSRSKNWRSQFAAARGKLESWKLRRVSIIKLRIVSPKNPTLCERHSQNTGREAEVNKDARHDGNYNFPFSPTPTPFETSNAGYATSNSIKAH